MSCIAFFCFFLALSGPVQALKTEKTASLRTDFMDQEQLSRNQVHLSGSTADVDGITMVFKRQALTAGLAQTVVLSMLLVAVTWWARSRRSAEPVKPALNCALATASKASLSVEQVIAPTTIDAAFYEQLDKKMQDQDTEDALDRLLGESQDIETVQQCLLYSNTTPLTAVEADLDEAIGAQFTEQMDALNNADNTAVDRLFEHMDQKQQDQDSEQTLNMLLDNSQSELENEMACMLKKQFLAGADTPCSVSTTATIPSFDNLVDDEIEAQFAMELREAQELDDDSYLQQAFYEHIERQQQDKDSEEILDKLLDVSQESFEDEINGMLQKQLLTGAPTPSLSRVDAEVDEQIESQFTRELEIMEKEQDDADTKETLDRLLEHSQKILDCEMSSLLSKNLTSALAPQPSRIETEINDEIEAQFARQLEEVLHSAQHA